MSPSDKDAEGKPARTKLEWIKLLTSFAVPLTIGIFTLVTSLQNRHIARQERDQDRRQAEDEQRETVYVSYINDISRFRDANIGNLTRNLDKLIYIRSKTLAALRTLDVERKKNILFFLKDSLLLSAEETSVLFQADFNGIRIEGDQCKFSDVIFFGAHFNDVFFRHCLFENVIFREISFRASDFTRSTFIHTQFIRCEMDEVNFHEAILSGSKFDGCSLGRADFTRVQFDSTVFTNVNLSAASVSSLHPMDFVEVKNSILPNGSFSRIESLRVPPQACESLDRWKVLPANSVEVQDCALVATAANVSVEHTVKVLFLERSVLVDAHRAEFHVQYNRNHQDITETFDVVFVGGRNGVYNVYEGSELSHVRAFPDSD